MSAEVRANPFFCQDSAARSCRKKIHHNIDTVIMMA